MLPRKAGVRKGGKGERRAREAREDRTRKDRAHFDFPLSPGLPPFLRPATQATQKQCRCHAFEKSVFYFQNKAVYRAEDGSTGYMFKISFT